VCECVSVCVDKDKLLNIVCILITMQSRTRGYTLSHISIHQHSLTISSDMSGRAAFIFAIAFLRSSWLAFSPVSVCACVVS
jgi:hypothetical protein